MTVGSFVGLFCSHRGTKLAPIAGHRGHCGHGVANGNSQRPAHSRNLLSLPRGCKGYCKATQPHERMSMSNQSIKAVVDNVSDSLPAASSITLKVNGTVRQIAVRPWVTLLDLLREYLDLTGTKKGCDHGQCGACTVLVNGRRINSCLTLAIMNDGAEVVTIEGLAQGDALHPLQVAFIEHDAFQCGYCTPGQICSGIGLINEGRAKAPDEIREFMSGNLCRCGAYPNILAAVEETVRMNRVSTKP